MKKRFYSNGKLLITGEYLVLDGAKSLALPTTFGQDLIVETGTNKTIQWKSYDADGTVWFEATITFDTIRNNHLPVNEPVKATLVKILHESLLLNPDFLNNLEGFTVTTHLTFPRLWGLGTSSTLINNVAQWFNIDAFELLRNSFGGSGYDIACAQNNTAILYQLREGKPNVTAIDFHPEFKKNICFVYLNQKQNSKTAIAAYKSKQHHLASILPEIDAVTDTVSTTSSFEVFQSALQSHEAIVSAVIDTPTIQSVLFNDFPGIIKSLGAWGGDFVMAVSDKDPTGYFKTKGFLTILTYKEMIL